MSKIIGRCLTATKDYDRWLYPRDCWIIILKTKALAVHWSKHAWAASQVLGPAVSKQDQLAVAHKRHQMGSENHPLR